MILFLEDWHKYPTARPDWDTSSVSFLELAKVYKAMGIKNYFFHLALIDPGLKGYDPMDPDLPEDIMIRVGNECKNNPWYFFREVLRIKPQASANPIRFKASRGNIGMYWAFFNHIDVILIQPRQTGKSVGADGLAIYLMFIATENTRINMLTKDDKLRVQQVERLKAMRDFLPKYLNPHNTKLDSDNSFELTCVKYGNEYSTAVPRNNEDGANQLGRGSTAPISFIDEPPFIPFIDVIIPAMLSATTAAVDEAKAYGSHYGNVFTTTAGKKDSTSGAYVFDMLKGAMVYDERLIFDARNGEEARLIVTRNSADGNTILNMTLSHLQLGYSDAWLREKMIKSQSKGEKAERDYLNRWTSGGLSSPLSTELNNKLREGEKLPLHVDVNKRGYAIRWYIPKEDIEHYMATRDCTIGLDTSEGIGRDAMAMVVVDNKSLKIVATSAINEVNIINYADFIADFMIKYTKTTLIPERRSTGGTIIDMLLIKLPMMGMDPFRRIYNTVIDDNTVFEKEEFRILYGDVDTRPRGHAEKYKRRFGFATSGEGRHSRTMLYKETLIRGAKLTHENMYDKQLIDELTSLVVKDERMDHKSSGHDDMVIAWMLAVWLLLSGRNLDHYGIRNPLRDVTEFYDGEEERAEATPYTTYVTSQQKYAREQIELLSEELSKADDDIIAMKVEARIRGLYNMAGELDERTPTFDDLVRVAKEKRRNKFANRGTRARNYYDEGSYLGVGNNGQMYNNMYAHKRSA